MSLSSQTMRIDISPDLRKEMRLSDTMRDGQLPLPEPLPVIPAAATTVSTLGDANFQRLFQSVYDGAIITDLSGRILDANGRAVFFLQYSRPELTGLNLKDIISGADDKTLATLQTGIEKDQFILIQAHCRRRDNTLFPTEIAVNHLQIKDTEYLCCFIRDISWRRQAEDMLRTVHTAIQHAATGIAVADLKGQVDYVNPAGARLWGSDRVQTIVGMNLKDLITDREAVTSMILAASKGESWDRELVLQQKTDSTLHVHVSVTPNRDVDGHLIGMVVSLLDISDRIRANSAEQKADRQRVMVESIGAACHHLGQPATILLSSLELMGRMGQNDKMIAEELLATSIDAAENIRKMLHNLNDIAEYKTTAYIDASHANGLAASRILDVSPKSGLGAS